MTAETNELDATRYYVYNADSLLVQTTDRDGRVTTYEYDHLGRETAERWLDAGQNVIHTFSYTYDADGEQLTASDSEGDYSYTYDGLGRVTSIVQDFGSTVVTFTQTFDADGERTQFASHITALGGLLSVDDFVDDYTYDSLGRVTRIEQHGVTGGDPVAAKRIDIAYDAASQWATITRYNNLAGTQVVAVGTYTFDDASRLVGLGYTKGETTLVGYTWSFDAGNNMTGATNTIDGTADYTNDATGQLTGADYDYQTNEAYTYDDNGNRITANGNTCTTGDDNQLTSDGTYTYLYDAEGNRTAKFIDANHDGIIDAGDSDITTYAWDYRDRLTSVTHFATYVAYSGNSPDQVVQYTYDYQNRLVQRTIDPDGAGPQSATDTYYVYDGNEIVASLDASGGIPTSGHRYLWNPQAVDQLLSDEAVDSLFSAGSVLWALTDHENTVRDLATYNSGTDVTTIANHRVFDAYGKLTSETNSAVDCLFGYTGRQFDEATGLQNNLNRWYDPVTGRWLSEDPIGYLGGLNLHEYCGNGPLILTDPSGTLDVRAWPFSDFGYTELECGSLYAQMWGLWDAINADMNAINKAAQELINASHKPGLSDAQQMKLLEASLYLSTKVFPQYKKARAILAEEAVTCTCMYPELPIPASPTPLPPLPPPLPPIILV